MLGDPEQRRKYDELGANWRAYEQAPGGPQGGRAGAGAVRRGGTYRTMDAGRGRRDVRRRRGFSDFFHTFFHGEPRPDQRGPGAAGARPRRRVRRRSDARRGVLRHDPPARPVGRRHRAHRRRPDSGRRQGRRARARRRRRRRGARGGDAGDLFLVVHLLPHRGSSGAARICGPPAVPVTTAVLGGEISVPTLAGRPCAFACRS